MAAFQNWFLEQLGMYAAYHRDGRNQATHHIGVPVIVFSIFLALTQVPIFHAGGMSVTVATALFAVVMLAYVVAVPLIGILTLAFYAAVYAIAVWLSGLPAAYLWAVAGTCFIGGWIIQFIGHVFEGRRPALTVNLIQIFMAPPFLIAEILFAIGAGRGLETEIRARSVKYLPQTRAA